MKAVRLQEPRGAIAIDDVDVRAPGPGEALVRMDACGVCHSDLFVGTLERLPQSNVRALDRKLEAVDSARHVKRGSAKAKIFSDKARRARSLSEEILSHFAFSLRLGDRSGLTAAMTAGEATAVSIPRADSVVSSSAVSLLASTVATAC